MRKKRQELYNSGPVDDSRKDKIIIFGVIMVCFFCLDLFLRSLIFRPLLLCWCKPRPCEEKFCLKACHDIDKLYKTYIRLKVGKTGYLKTTPRSRILHNRTPFSIVYFLFYLSNVL